MRLSTWFDIPKLRKKLFHWKRGGDPPCFQHRIPPPSYLVLSSPMTSFAFVFSSQISFHPEKQTQNNSVFLKTVTSSSLLRKICLIRCSITWWILSHLTSSSHSEEELLEESELDEEEDEECLTKTQWKRGSLDIFLVCKLDDYRSNSIQ